MDAERFDTVAKTLIAHPNRRAALRLLAGGALSAAKARLGWAEAKNKRRRNKKRKKPCGTAGARCCKGRKCTEGAVCNEVGYCRCATGRRNCGGACILPEECCVDGKRLGHGAVYRDCGVCTFGTVLPSKPCRDGATQSGCRACSENTYLCEPVNDGQPCGTEKACCRDHCLPVCPEGEARDPDTCTCGFCSGGTGSVQATRANRTDRRPPDRGAVQGQGIGGPCDGIPPCPWPEVGQGCCDEFNGYVCTANKVCCQPEDEPCGGSPKSWGCCCNTAAGEVCNPNFDNTSGSECCPCKDGGVRCLNVCCKPGERCDFNTQRCVACPVG